MRATCRLAAVLVAAALAGDAAADPRPTGPRPDPTPPPGAAPLPVPRGPRTVVVTLHPRRAVILVDRQSAPPITLQPLASPPPPRCKKDRRGTVRCQLRH
jgi:hypothetical protein